MWSYESGMEFIIEWIIECYIHFWLFSGCHYLFSLSFWDYNGQKVILSAILTVWDTWVVWGEGFGPSPVVGGHFSSHIPYCFWSCSTPILIFIQDKEWRHISNSDRGNQAFTANSFPFFSLVICDLQRMCALLYALCFRVLDLIAGWRSRI